MEFNSAFKGLMTADWFIFRRLSNMSACRGQLKCDGTRAETRFSLSRETEESF